MKPRSSCPCSAARQGERLIFRADDERDRGDEDEHQPDGEQHLVELGRPVEPPIEQALEHHAHRGGDDETERQRRDETEIGAVHRQHDDVAAEHGEGAVGEVDEPISPMVTDRPTDTMNSTMPADSPPNRMLTTSVPKITSSLVIAVHVPEHPLSCPAGGIQ